MLAIANEKHLYLLEFIESYKLKDSIRKLEEKNAFPIALEKTYILRSIEREISLYFEGMLQEFKTPVFHEGTPFQKSVWNRLKTIPLGKTQSYLQIARDIHNPFSYRAVAQANSANRLALIIPCHRTIKANGSLSGYAWGIKRKQFLLYHETTNF